MKYKIRYNNRTVDAITATYAIQPDCMRQRSYSYVVASTADCLPRDAMLNAAAGIVSGIQVRPWLDTSASLRAALAGCSSAHPV